MKSIIALAFLITVHIAIVACATLPFSYSCGSSSCASPSHLTITLNQCNLTCDPCNPANCAYQNFLILNGQVYSNIWSDSQCSQWQSSNSYPCGSCSTFETTNSLTPECANIVYDSAVETSTFNAYCGSSTCGNTALETGSLEYNKCQFYCNPCNTTMCISQSYQEFNGVVTQNIYQDTSCSSWLQTNTFGCSQCDATTATDSFSLNCDSQTNPTNPVDFEYWCDSTTCATTAMKGTVPLDECVWSCNPCDASQCIWQTFHKTGDTVVQTTYQDSNCLTGASPTNRDCSQCFTLGGDTSFTIECTSNAITLGFSMALVLVACIFSLLMQ